LQPGQLKKLGKCIHDDVRLLNHAANLAKTIQQVATRNVSPVAS
jgi:hypothetical protein